MKSLSPDLFETADHAREYIMQLEHEFQNESGVAGYTLALIYSEENTFIPNDVKRAIGVSDIKALAYQIRSYDLLKKDADSGDGESMHLIASYYQCGMQPVKSDKKLFGEWTQKAVDAGYNGALENLIAIRNDPTSEFYDPNAAKTLLKKLLN